MRIILSTLIGIILISISSCVGENKSQSVAESAGVNSIENVFFKSRKSCNSVYHWKTEFNPTEEEWGMMKRHNVSRLYVKMFDVVYDSNLECQLVPVATTKFKQKPQGGVEIVPCVYITVDAMRHVFPEVLRGSIAGLIVDRVLNMVDYNDLGEVKEIQLDCDWTASTRDNFFTLCESIKKILEKKGVALSVTIRLHQLTQTCPPAHFGMLMLYNTGALKSSKTQNSILSYDDVALYLKNSTYELPLDFAYPAFSWFVWFRDDKFQALITEVDLSNKNLYKKVKDNIYEVTRNHDCSGQQLKKGDILRYEAPSVEEVLKVKHAVERQLKNSNYSVAIYHISSKDIKKISEDEINNIYDK